MNDKVTMLDKQIAALQEERAKEVGKLDARSKVEALLKDLGYTMEQLFDAPPAKTASKSSKAGGSTGPKYNFDGTLRKAKAISKYHNIGKGEGDKKTQTWQGEDSGKPKPHWFAKAEAEGKDMTKYIHPKWQAE